VKKAIGAVFAAAAILAFGSSGIVHRPAQAHTIEEDDPRWDCKTMGNHICGEIIWFNVGGELQGYELNAPSRPACRVEPSNTRVGYEVIFYPNQDQADDIGFEVTCPSR